MKYANDFYVDTNDVVRWKSNDRVLSAYAHLIIIC